LASVARFIVNKVVKGSFYVLTPIAVFLLAMFFLTPQHKDNPYMKIYSSSDDQIFSGCEFSGDKHSSQSYKFSMTPQECRLIQYDGSSSVQFSVDYPHLNLVRYGGDGIKLPIYFYMERVSMETFDSDRHLRGKSPVRSEYGIDTYLPGGLTERRFVGHDGVPVYARDYDRAIRANRIYGKGLWVFYMYPNGLSDVRAMDDFILGVLDEVVVD